MLPIVIAKDVALNLFALFLYRFCTLDHGLFSILLLIYISLFQLNCRNSNTFRTSSVLKTIAKSKRTYSVNSVNRTLFVIAILEKEQFDSTIIIKNASSSTSHNKLRLYNLNIFRLSLQEFKKILPNTFIYESILIKIYMNVNIIKY
jgi:hypothetical protein